MDYTFDTDGYSVDINLNTAINNYLDIIGKTIKSVGSSGNFLILQFTDDKVIIIDPDGLDCVSDFPADCLAYYEFLFTQLEIDTIKQKISKIKDENRENRKQSQLAYLKQQIALLEQQ